MEELISPTQASKKMEELISPTQASKKMEELISPTQASKKMEELISPAQASKKRQLYMELLIMEDEEKDADDADYTDLIKLPEIVSKITCETVSYKI